MANPRELEDDRVDGERVTLRAPGGGNAQGAPARPAARGTDEPARREAPAQANAAAAPDALLASLDAELRTLFQRAAWLGGLGGEPRVSFTSLFLALFGGGTPMGDWVVTTARDTAVDARVVLDHWKRVSPRASAGLTIEHVQARKQVDGAALRSTAAVNGLLALAGSYRRDGRGEIGARHMLAAYLFSDVGRNRDFQGWGLRTRSWAARLAVALDRRYPDEAWRTICTTARRFAASPRLNEVLHDAAYWTAERGGELTGVADVVYALLHHGASWSGDAVANVWLRKRLEQLGGAALAQLPAMPAIETGPYGGGRARIRASLDAELESWLRDAQLWSMVSTDPEVGIRHMVAALLAPRAPSAGRRIVRQLGGGPSVLSQELSQLIGDTVSTEDHATWRWLLAHDLPVHQAPRPGYANDAARGPDALAIGGEVRALAAVLASEETRPPLSVGLFGNWGSGKSFFMAMLRDHIRALADQSCGAERTAYCAQIAQIEFNAWHYIDGDLWASLVSHVLDSLESHFRGDTRSLAEQRRLELARTQLQRAEVDRREEALRQRRSQLEALRAASAPSAAAIAHAIEDEAVRMVAAEARQDVRRELDRVGKQIGLAPGELSLAGVRERVTAIRAWWKQLSLRALVTGTILIAIAGGIAVAAAWFKQGLVAAVALIAPLVTVIARIIQIGAPIARASRQVNDLGQSVIENMARLSPEALEEQRKIDAEQATLAAERQALDRQAEELRALLDREVKPGIREYVLDRATQYRDRLGIIASVHRDFRNLSEQLRDDTTEPRLQRIILYIDDLDRCPPKRVVEMLQAIHLLLSFELFVVVVAVDPKWLLRSLEAYYADQFAGTMAAPDDREARPQFYLEKIFQIPYALRPMTASRFGSMVGALLEPSVAPETARARPAAGYHESAAPDASTGTAAPPAHPSPPPAAPPPAEPAASVPVDLTPRNLEITRGELEHLRTLGSLVSSPRATKRLANLYRIVRAGLDGEALDEFLDARYELTQTVLAAVVGCSDIAVPWFKHVFAAGNTDIAGMLAPLEALAATSPRARFLLEEIRRCTALTTPPQLVEICALAARYSFETGALLELLPI